MGDQTRVVIRISACATALLVVLLTFRMIVPWLVNQHNDGALILAPIAAFAAVVCAILFVVHIFQETEK